MKNSDELKNLEGQVRSITEQAKNEFGHLRADQLNWKPAPMSWSVAQCLDHLMTTNGSYFPILQSIATGEKKATVFEKLPVFPNLWARLLLGFVSPESTRKVKAPAKFQPSLSDLPGSIIEDFTSHQHRLSEAISSSADLNAGKVIITSPAASFVTYSLLDAFRILVAHEHRHFQQAMRVKANENFPN